MPNVSQLVSKVKRQVWYRQAGAKRKTVLRNWLEACVVVASWTMVNTENQLLRCPPCLLLRLATRVIVSVQCPPMIRPQCRPTGPQNCRRIQQLL